MNVLSFYSDVLRKNFGHTCSLFLSDVINQDDCGEKIGDSKINLIHLSQGQIYFNLLKRSRMT